MRPSSPRRATRPARLHRDGRGARPPLRLRCEGGDAPLHGARAEPDAVALAPDAPRVRLVSERKLYRVNPKETDPAKAGVVLGDPKEAAIWALAFGPDGTLYAGRATRAASTAGRPRARSSSSTRSTMCTSARSSWARRDGIRRDLGRGLVVAIGPRAPALSRISRGPRSRDSPLTGRAFCMPRPRRSTSMSAARRPPTAGPARRPLDADPVAGEEVPKGSVSIARRRPGAVLELRALGEQLRDRDDRARRLRRTCVDVPRGAVFALRFDEASVPSSSQPDRGTALRVEGPRRAAPRPDR